MSKILTVFPPSTKSYGNVKGSARPANNYRAEFIVGFEGIPCKLFYDRTELSLLLQSVTVTAAARRTTKWLRRTTTTTLSFTTALLSSSLRRRVGPA